MAGLTHIPRKPVGRVVKRSGGMIANPYRHPTGTTKPFEATAITDFSAWLTPLSGNVTWSIDAGGQTFDNVQAVNGEKQSIMNSIRAQIVQMVPDVDVVTQTGADGNEFKAYSNTAALANFSLSYLHT